MWIMNAEGVSKMSASGVKSSEELLLSLDVLGSKSPAAYVKGLNEDGPPPNGPPRWAQGPQPPRPWW